MMLYFKKIFGVKENEKLLISYLNSILKPMGNGKINIDSSILNFSICFGNVGEE
ncbi:hypothetical protein [Clostridium sp. UBA4395]|uniref:hypothetical protein n=1 Tax=Clostridium sp. UBA4395 TaxID=1946360 RepID=UPI003216B2D4